MAFLGTYFTNYQMLMPWVSSADIGADPSNIVFRGTIYRAFKEDLTLSGMTAQAVVPNAYQMNLGRFA